MNPILLRLMPTMQAFTQPKQLEAYVSLLNACLATATRPPPLFTTKFMAALTPFLPSLATPELLNLMDLLGTLNKLQPGFATGKAVAQQLKLRCESAIAAGEAAEAVGSGPTQASLHASGDVGDVAAADVPEGELHARHAVRLVVALLDAGSADKSQQESAHKDLCKKLLLTVAASHQRGAIGDGDLALLFDGPSLSKCVLALHRASLPLPAPILTALLQCAKSTLWSVPPSELIALAAAFMAYGCVPDVAWLTGFEKALVSAAPAMTPMQAAAAIAYLYAAVTALGNGSTYGCAKPVLRLLASRVSRVSEPGSLGRVLLALSRLGWREDPTSPVLIPLVVPQLQHLTAGLDFASLLQLVQVR